VGFTAMRYSAKTTPPMTHDAMQGIILSKGSMGSAQPACDRSVCADLGRNVRSHYRAKLSIAQPVSLSVWWALHTNGSCVNLPATIRRCNENNIWLLSYGQRSLKKCDACHRA